VLRYSAPGKRPRSQLKASGRPTFASVVGQNFERLLLKRGAPLPRMNNPFLRHCSGDFSPLG
jgi:hypothetical protein